VIVSIKAPALSTVLFSQPKKGKKPKNKIKNKNNRSIGHALPVSTFEI
jgi:hypothetical protein